MAEYIDYIEIAVPDVGAAREFYGAAFGWKFADYGPEYAGIRSADGSDEVGGLTSGGEPPDVRAALRSAELDATLAAIVSAGGTIVREPFDYPGGRRFHFTDPAGNELAVYQPAT